MFSIYSFEDNDIHVQKNLPTCCSRFFDDTYKKCKRFYDGLKSNEDGHIVRCPYGFSCVQYDNEVYIGLIIKGYSDYSKVKGNLKNYGETVKNYSNYTEKDILNSISEYRFEKHRMEIFEKTVHDIKNATRSMLDITENLEESELQRLPDNIYNAVVGYGLIKYRLDYHDFIIDGKGAIEQRRGKLNAHKMMNKLRHQLQYKAKKKGITITLSGSTDEYVYQNVSLYLGFFQLVENAVKYALTETEVKISFEDNLDGSVEVKVENQCKKIGEDEIDNLTKKGYRSLSANRSTNGSGLGLYLAKEIFHGSGCTLDFAYKPKDEKEGFFTAKVVVSSIQQ